MSPSGRLQGVATFVHVAEAGSFTLAAERLGLSKSAVGKSIARLEDRLGVRLINRTTRSFNLTADGEAFYEASARVLSELDAAETLLASRKRAPAGRLRIDLPSSLGRRRVVPVLLALAGRYPELEFEMSFGDRRVDLIEERVDLAVRMGEMEDSVGLITRRLFVQRSTICASPAYLKRHGVPKTFDDLSNHECICYGRNGVLEPWQVEHKDGRSLLLPIRGRIVMGHGEALLDVAIAGHGLAYLSTWLAADAFAAGTLKPVLMSAPVENIPVHAIWPQTRNMAPKLRVVIDELVRHFEPLPPWDKAFT